ncbi:MAG: glycosyltransferase family 2 protein [Candidatus Hydrogenedentes bacterium]|nr:glycosyltransferase family 2 protein [Candidatus Hydrogenedentota bacterium]
MSAPHPEISIVIPTYNESENILSVLSEIKEVMDNIDRPYEIIVVDDGSTDGTLEVLKKNLSTFPNLRIIRLTRNFGQHPAIYAGFNYSRGKIIVTIDADGQNPPSEIPRLIQTLEEGNYDFVQGWRKERKGTSIRKIFSRIVNWTISKITRSNLKDIGCGMACFTKSTTQKLLQASHHFRYIPAEVAWMGLKVYSLPISQRERVKGKSRYRVWSLFWVNFDIIASISTLPVEVIGFIGVIFSLIGFAMGTRILLRRILWGLTYNDMATVTALFFFLVGVQILCTSVLCAYISRTYREVQHRPYYIVQQVMESYQNENRTDE